jgi:hypothetical protein
MNAIFSRDELVEAFRKWNVIEAESPSPFLMRETNRLDLQKPAELAEKQVEFLFHLLTNPQK